MIPSQLSTPPPPSGWASTLFRWLNHVWSFCTTTLASLMGRVSLATKDRFPPPEASQQTVSPLHSKKISSPVPPSPSHDATMNLETHSEKSEEVETALFPPDLFKSRISSLHLGQQAPENDRTAPTREALLLPEPIDLTLNDQILDDDLESQDARPPAPVIEQPLPDHTEEKTTERKEGTRPYRRRVRRRTRTGPQTENRPQPDQRQSMLPDTPLQIPKASPHCQAVKQEPIILECGGGGDCQLLSFLKGLEMQHPHLSQTDKGQGWVSYTALELRQMGVDFAIKQIDSCGTHAQSILEYLDIDRKEYNADQVDPVMREWERGNEILNKRLADKKISQENFDRQRKGFRERILKKAKTLETHIVSKSDADFLERLKRQGFSCASLHLFALSCMFNVPIKVHEKDGTPGHDIQTFNGSGSDLLPVHLYRVNRGHYQLLIYPS